MKQILYYLTYTALYFFFSCQENGGPVIKSDPLSEEQAVSQFKTITDLINRKPQSLPQSDSLSVLIIPIDASCNSCRDYSIDALMKNKDKLNSSRKVIISATNDKIIKNYLIENHITLPDNSNLSLDDSSYAFKTGLIFEHPAAFYISHKKVYSKVDITPNNIKNSINTFFNLKNMN